jgi:hypothetical protein
MHIQKIINLRTYQNISDALDNEDQLNVYVSGEKFTESFEDDLLDTTIKLPDNAPDLLVSKKSEKTSKYDAQNAILIYEYLIGLSRVQAADSRLWTTLTHTTFWSYCQGRWPVATSKNYVLEHWFELKGRGLGALRRNAISRLWWAAHLTVAPWEESTDLEVFKSSDRYKYTRIMLDQQQTFMDILEREYGSNLNMRICILDSLGRFHKKVSNKDGLTKSVAVKLTLLMKSRKLDALSIKELLQVIDELVETVAKKLNLITPPTSS